MSQVVFVTEMDQHTVSRVLEPAPAHYQVQFCHPEDDNRLVELMHNAEFVIEFGSIGPSDTALRAGQHVKLIQLVSAGFEHLNTTLCQELGIPVANNGGANATDVAEHAVMLMLAVYRRLVEQDANVRHGRYTGIDTGTCTYTLRGKTIGLVGLGNIGRATASLLGSFGTRLLYADQSRAPTNVEQDLGLEFVSLTSLLEQSDIVSLHTPLDDSTRNLISSEELGRMKSDAVLINTCRGGVVDQQALTKALQQHQIRAAGLDVQAQEPVDPDDPLLSLDNIILTPHIAGVTADTWARRGEFVFTNLERVRNGQTPLAVVA